MEPTTILFTVAGALVVIAILLWILGLGKNKEVQSTNPAMGTMAVPGVKPPPAKRMVNRKGWRAPTGCHFNDADELISITGDLIVDLMIIAEMCGITDFITEEGVHHVDALDPPVEEVSNADEVTTEPAPAIESAPHPLGSAEKPLSVPELVGTESIASRPEPAVAPAPMPEPVKEAFTSLDPEPVKTDYGAGYGEDFGDSGGGDSGGSDD